MKKTITTLLALAIATSISFAGLFDGKPQDLKIKGLYIGMPMEEALGTCKSTVAGTSIAEWADAMQIEKSEDGTSMIAVRNVVGNPLLLVLSDANGKVRAFAFEYPAVNVLFNAKDMELKEFAQLFVDSYKLPGLDPDEEGENLVHTLESGVKVTITKDKGIVVSSTASQTERKAAFN